MRYCRFLFENKTRYGALEDRNGEPWIVSLIAAPEEDLPYRLEHKGTTAPDAGFAPMPLSAANLLAPVTPSKIVCVGRNYLDRAAALPEAAVGAPKARRSGAHARSLGPRGL
jgi:2-keto-4-pentenoate hydratase/2-oxohepta-3-ene-1,7-dioic acid hydratase in catechol pathway